MNDPLLDAAAAVLATDANAAMAEIAAAAGVGRATLYRRYPTREDLIAALRDRIRADFRAAQLAFEATGDLEAFVLAVLRLRESALSPRPDEDRLRRMWAPLRTTIATETGLPPDWAVASLRALLRAAGQEVDARRLSHEEAAALVVKTLLR